MKRWGKKKGFPGTRAPDAVRIPPGFRGIRINEPPPPGMVPPPPGGLPVPAPASKFVWTAEDFARALEERDECPGRYDKRKPIHSKRVSQELCGYCQLKKRLESLFS